MHEQLIAILRPFENRAKWEKTNHDAGTTVKALRMRRELASRGDTDGVQQVDEILANLENDLRQWCEEWHAARTAIESKVPKLLKYFPPIGQSCYVDAKERAEAVATLIGELLADVPVYVDLDQMAAAVGRKKAALEKLKSRKANPLPDPDIHGGGGVKDEWDWNRVRPWLETEFGRRLGAAPKRLI
jgi:hypothetical protein